MPKFTVVISDRSKHDAGYRKNRMYWWLARQIGGYGELCLYWFLCEYFGESSVRLVRPSELLKLSSPLRTDYLMVGVPTLLHEQHLQNVHYRKLVLYDSSDHDGINFLYSDEKHLLSKADCCLKHFRDRRWTLPVRIGLLPIKRPPRNNRLHWKLQSVLHRQVAPVTDRQFDVGFVARPTGDPESNIRLRWLIELVRDGADLSLWGGLVGGQSWEDLLSETDIPGACWMGRRKIGFSDYFDGLSRSKVALAPPGYAPWTFRHYEAVYAGCMVVTTDLSDFEFLIPLPESSLVQLQQGESVVDGVRRAIQLGISEPERTRDARAELDQWLNLGKYDASCLITKDRFMSNLEA